MLLLPPHGTAPAQKGQKLLLAPWVELLGHPQTTVGGQYQMSVNQSSDCKEPLLIQ